jgi:hypothetical protein
MGMLVHKTANRRTNEEVGTEVRSKQAKTYGYGSTNRLVNNAAGSATVVAQYNRGGTKRMRQPAGTGNALTPSPRATRNCPARPQSAWCAQYVKAAGGNEQTNVNPKNRVPYAEHRTVAVQRKTATAM